MWLALRHSSCGGRGGEAEGGRGRGFLLGFAFVRGSDGDDRETLIAVKARTGAQEVASAAEEVLLRLTAGGWLWLSLRRPCISNKDYCTEKDDPGDA